MNTILASLAISVIESAIEIAEFLRLPSCDGVPWSIHKIMDETAHDAAVAAWKAAYV